ncbi:MAG: hypothetical protein NPIRA06_27800 [Nitrospirales bacterium]|nr:MAG: hypothetical protein NPIRA06_27800 [Nitrospirales bacterium]
MAGCEDYDYDSLEGVDTSGSVLAFDSLCHYAAVLSLGILPTWLNIPSSDYSWHCPENVFPSSLAGDVCHDISSESRWEGII